jgi:nucleoside-diphosphate-sugar epimerase
MEGADARLELLEADLLNPASFDACVHGAEVVFHTASPFITSGITDPMAQLVEPAVEGTLAVLKAAASAGTVERVVLTSSVAAVMGGVGDKDGCFNEDGELLRLQSLPFFSFFFLVCVCVFF